MDERTSQQFSFVQYQLPAVLWALLIFVSSSLPSESIPDLPILRYDKAVHFGIYFLFAFLAYRALRYQRRYPLLSRRALLFTVIAIVTYGAIDEFHQYFVPGRDSELLDLVADTAGACVLVAVVWWRNRGLSVTRKD